MKELQKQRLEGSGGKLLKPKMRLVKGTKFVSVLFIAASILISAGIMKAANSVYYDLDTNTIMVTETQIMSGDLTINNNSTTKTTSIGTGTTTGAVTIGGGSNDVIINSDTWDVSSTGVMSGMILNPATGTATAGTAPLKFTTGTSLTTPEAGAMEFSSSVLYFTPVATRYRVGVLNTVADLKLCTYASATGTIDCNTDTSAVGHDPLTIAAFSETGDAEGLNLATQALTLHGATVTTPGGVSISAQTFNGLKTFDDGATSTGTLTASNALTSAGSTTLATGAGTTNTFGSGASSINTIGSATTPGTLALLSGAGTWDATSLSLDATGNSNVTVTGAGTTLTLAAAGGTTNKVIVNSAGTGTDAIDINATGTGGGLDIDTTDGTIALTAGGAANGNINLVAGHDFSLTGVANSIFGIATGNVAQFVNIGTGTAVDTINIGTGGTGIDVIRIGDSLADLALTDTQWSVTAAGAATFISMDAGSGAVSGGAGTLASLAVGGGYGSTGSTFDTNGNIQANGALTLGTASSVSGDITLYNSGSTFWQKIATSAASSNQTYTLRTTGGTIAMTDDINVFEASGILRGQVNIFGFDYPAQCSSSCVTPTYKIVSREIQALPNFPAVLANATRTHRLVIRYGAALNADGDDVTVVAYNVTTPGAIATWTIDQATAAGATVEKGYAYVTTDFTAPATDDWDVRVGVPASGVVRIYSIDLAAYDIN